MIALLWPYSGSSSHSQPFLDWMAQTIIILATINLYNPTKNVIICDLCHIVIDHCNDYSFERFNDKISTRKEYTPLPSSHTGASFNLVLCMGMGNLYTSDIAPLHQRSSLLCTFYPLHGQCMGISYTLGSKHISLNSNKHK